MSDDRSLLSVGDTVRLKSGGPRMTVIAISDTHATVKWHDEATHMHTERLPREAIDVDGEPAAEGLH